MQRFIVAIVYRSGYGQAGQIREELTGKTLKVYVYLLKPSRELSLHPSSSPVSALCSFFKAWNRPRRSVQQVRPSLLPRQQVAYRLVKVDLPPELQLELGGNP